MLLAIATADAYAIPWEFVTNPEQHGLVNDLQSYQQHPKYGPAGELVPSQYTDDTLRSIATALVVINGFKGSVSNGSVFDPSSYVKALQLVVNNDRRKGWSKRFQSFLEDNLESSPVDFLRNIKGRSASNGSIMGCLPLAFMKRVEDVRLAAIIQAITTHGPETGVEAQRMALSAYHLLNGGRPDTLIDFINSNIDGEPEFDYSRPPGPVSMLARDTAYAVLHLLTEEEPSMAAILRAAVDLGGDTDSVAALAVGIASCSKHYAHDLPAKLVNELDNGHGQYYLASIDRMLGRIGE